MIFPQLQGELTVQENDPTRLDASRSFITPDEAAVTLVEIEPYTGAGFIELDESDSFAWFLDYAYSSAGNKVATIRVTTDGSPVTKTFTVAVITAATDKLLTSDNDLITHEPGINNYLRPGRRTFLDIHRQARDNLLDYLDQQGVWNTDSGRLTKDNLTDTDSFKQWVKYEALRLIFSANSNAIDDIHANKARAYEKLRDDAGTQKGFRLDLNGDNETDELPYDNMSAEFVRR